MTRPSRSLLACCTLVLALGPVACSSSGGDAGDTTTSTTAPASTTTEATDEPADETTTTEADEPGTDPEAQARADAALLQDGDLTDPGWTGTPRTAADDDGNVLDECLPSDTVDAMAARARSDIYELEEGGGSLSLTSGSAVFEDRDAAEAVLAHMATPEFASCATDQTTSANPELKGEYQATDPLPDLGDEAIGFGGDFTVTDPSTGEDHRVSVLAIAIRTDDVVSTVTMSGVDHDLDEPTLYPLLDLVAERQAG